MESLTAFDAAVLIVIAVSTIAAFAKGFVTVALSFAAWFGAFFAATGGFSHIQSYGRDLIQPPELADIITLVALFFLTLIVLKLLAGWIGSAVKASPVGFLDRSLGALFGILRGFVIISIAYLAFTKLYPAGGPDWVQNARLKPLVSWAAEMVEGFAQTALGQDSKQIGTDYLEKTKNAIPSQYLNEQIEKEAAKYLNTERKKLDSLFDDLANDTKTDASQDDGDGS